METPDKRLTHLREKAKEGRDPTCADETLALLLQTAQRFYPARVLEIGAAEGLTSVAFCMNGARVTAIEFDPDRAAAARRNFEAFGVTDCVELLEGDAGEILPLLQGE